VSYGICCVAMVHVCVMVDANTPDAASKVSDSLRQTVPQWASLIEPPRTRDTVEEYTHARGVCQLIVIPMYITEVKRDVCTRICGYRMVHFPRLFYKYSLSLRHSFVHPLLKKVASWTG
jgi:hypothetical protein